MQAELSAEVHRIEDLIELFNQQFLPTHRTVLCSGAVEPIYLPADNDTHQHRIFAREDFFNSGLHEIAHWCIAGSDRRKLVDYGYWYEADGRGACSQSKFEAVEAKPQALEWLFCQAANCRFRPSIDNIDSLNSSDFVESQTDGRIIEKAGLGPMPCQPSAFTSKIILAAIEWISKPLPVRAQRFIIDLESYYGGKVEHSLEYYRDSVF